MAKHTKNAIDPDRMAEVLRLSFVDGLSARAISRKLGVSRNTVRRMLGRAPKASTRTSAARHSIIDAYEPALKDWLDDTPELKAPTALERLRKLGYTGGITVVRDRLRRLRPIPNRRTYLTLDFAPGEAMQVDWADFGFAIPGCPRRVSALVMVLCHSRYLYLEFTLSQSFGTFLRAFERGLEHFGGTTEIDIFDNMRTVVREGSGRHAILNSKFLTYAQSRGFAARACNRASGHEKGRVERPISFVRERFWTGRHPSSLLDLNRQAKQWQDEFANKRIHEVTGKIPSLVFEHEERLVLKPLPGTPFETDDIETATVTKQFRVRFDRNTYSVPPRFVGQHVIIRANDDGLAVFLGPKRIALHRRRWDVHKDIEDSAHRASAIEKRPRGDTAIPPALVGLGETAAEYFGIFRATHRSIKREAERLTFLSELFGERHTAAAMREVMHTGHVGAEYVEYVLRHKRKLRPQGIAVHLGDPALDHLSFEPPDLSVYDQLVPTRKTLDPGDDDS
ncbi:MAG: IS21 family transposase [Myxococcota bacterium]